jgi:hypothetical protein
MKKILIAAATLLSTVVLAGSHAEVNEKVLKAFNATFTTAQEVVWQEYEDHYTVNFKQSEIQTRVRYDKEGNMIESFRHYGEDQLPPLIVNRIKTKYTDKKIFGVTERSSTNDMVYHVVLEGKKDWTKIKVDIAGHIEVEEKYLKASK